MQLTEHFRYESTRQSPPLHTPTARAYRVKSPTPTDRAYRVKSPTLTARAYTMLKAQL
jgi:hypothetical protein